MADIIQAKMVTKSFGTETIVLEHVDGELTFAEAGYTNGASVNYKIFDGVRTEIGVGTYVSSGVKLLRRATSRLNLAGRPAYVVAYTTVAEPVEIGSGDNNVADNTIVRFDGTAGNLQDSGATVSDAGVITASGFSGPLTGNVTGNVIGDVTGDVVGDISNTALLSLAGLNIELTGETKVVGRASIEPTTTESIPTLSVKEVEPYIYQTIANAVLDDLTAGLTTFTGANGDMFLIEIDSVGATDTFKWRKNAEAWTETVAITGEVQNLSNGVYVTFGAITGHTLGDDWAVEAASQTQPSLAVQNYSGTNLVTIGADGVVFPVQATTLAQPTYVEGGLYYDTSLHKLCVGGVSGWETITSVAQA